MPAGEEMRTNGTWYDKKDRHGQVANRFKRYAVPFNVCQGCRFQQRCVSEKTLEQRHGRMLERSEHQEAVELKPPAHGAAKRKRNL